MAVLEIKNLNFSYPATLTKALADISFKVEKGSFVAVCGSTGSGKSTLLRMLKRELTPLGELSGHVLYNGMTLDKLDDFTSACKIGFVMQRPEQQIVTDKVWHELAFGLENMSVPTDSIRRRVSEMACYFGIEDWFDKEDVNQLSGGQKQLLNLASVMVMQPDVLILDEPTAQLDPIAASDFIATLSKLNRELSLTIIIVEHRLEEVIPVSDMLLALDGGKLLAYGETRQTAQNLKSFPALLEGMPAALRLYSAFDIKTECPITVREGRNFVEGNFDDKIKSLDINPYVHSPDAALEFSDVYFRYSRELQDVLKGLSFKVYEGEIFCILGGNGSGKSTTLYAAASLNKIYSGSIRVFGKLLKEYKNQSLYQNCLSLLPQDVQTVFLKNTVREELDDSGSQYDSFPFDLSNLMDKHPYDLSGGQQQLAALAKVLATKPRLLLLDEPTKGLDAHSKHVIIEVMRKLKASGVTIIAVTHDVEFAAECSDRCAMFFRGEITSCDVPHSFFAENSFYTTAANRMTRGFFNNAITLDDVVKLCRNNNNNRKTRKDIG